MEYRPGLNYPVEIRSDGARKLSLQPCTVEDAIRFTHALHTLATTGQLAPPMQPAEVVAARHAQGDYSPDDSEGRVRAAWDRALLATTKLWICTAIHSGPALGWLHPGEHTLLLLVGSTGISNEYLAVTDLRVFRGSAPGRKTKDHAPGNVRQAVLVKGWLTDAVKVEMHDGSSLKLTNVDPDEGAEFVDALNTLVATGSLPRELLPFR